jgi:hypothetical protein
MPSIKDIRRKASQWSFVIPSFTSAVVDRLSNLLSDNVMYITFAICDDDTGNRYLQGYIKFSRRCRDTILRRLIGPAIFSTCAQVYETIMEIQMNPSFNEFGKDDPSEQFRTEISSLKRLIGQGATIFQVLESFPHACVRNPHAVRKYIEKVAAPISTRLQEELLQGTINDGYKWLEMKKSEEREKNLIQSQPSLLTPS